MAGSFDLDAIGNITTPSQTRGYAYEADVTCAAGNRTLPHAVSAAGADSYGYDCNGHMTMQIENGVTYTQTFDAENRPTAVQTITGTTRFIYDGNRIVQVGPDGSRVIYVNALTEIEYPVVPAPPPTGTHTVTKQTDTNDGACNADCSLREASRAANANSNADYRL